MTAHDDAIAAALPLSWVDFHILLALAAEPLHGYGIMTDTERRTNGRVTLEPGNLYRALKRLQDRAWVERADDVLDASGEDERRRYYRVTALGRRVAAAEAERMAELVGMARDRRLTGPGA